MKQLVNRPMLLSIGLAALGGLAAFLALSGQGETPAASAQTVSVVVTTRPLGVGQRLTVADLLVKQVPAAAVPLDAVRAPAAAEGRYATLPLLQGEVLVAQKLSDQSPGSNLASLIPPGRVAVSVAVSDVVSTGFIAPGDHVDVLGIVTGSATDLAQLVLSDVVVLAVSSTVIGTNAPATVAKAGSQSPTSVDETVTFAMTTDEARRLVQVDEVATLRLALRGRTAEPAVAQRP